MYDYTELQCLLQEELKTDCNMLTSDISHTDAEILWLRNSLWKKFQGVISPDADAKCLSLFKESNERCRIFTLSPKDLFEELVVGEVKTIFDNLFFSGPDQNYNLSDIFEECGTGPGASLHVDSYNFYTKLFDSSLSGTSEPLYRYYRYAISANPTWLSAENAREGMYGHRIVEGNRLSFVPKTSAISRSICTEPVLNMFLQKGIGAVFERVLKRKFRIDLSYQPLLNRDLARIGSMTGSYGTIDLSCASDSMSLVLLKEILPSYVLHWLEISRSPKVVYPDNTSGELHMVSSMGNAYTFPLQTLLFSVIVAAVYRLAGIHLHYGPRGPVNFGVFGDDIIVLKKVYFEVIRALQLFGFLVNDDKSFNSGYFRESCGGDFWKGRDIRGVYIKSLSSDADIYSVYNRLARWSSRSGVLLPKTSRWLLGKAPFLPIPFADGDAEGFKTPNPPPSSKYDRNTGACIYRALVKQSMYVRIPTSIERRGFYRKHKLRREIFYNADGILVSLVGGFIRDGRLGIRTDAERFKVRRRKTSSWRNYTAGSFTLGLEWILLSELYLSKV